MASSLYIPGLDLTIEKDTNSSTSSSISGIFKTTGNRFTKVYSTFTDILIFKDTYPIVVTYAHDNEVKEGVMLVHYEDDESTGCYSMMSEISLLCRLNHKNIITFYGTVYDDSISRLFLSFERFECYLSQVIEDKELIETPFIKSMMEQLLKGLQYMHSNNTIHRDICPKNLVFTEKGTLKITNFRNAQHIKEHSKQVANLDFRYQSVNCILKDKKIYTADDIWSANCILAELILKKRIFEKWGRQGVLKDIFGWLGQPFKVWPEINDLPFAQCMRVTCHKYNLLGRLFNNEIERKLIAWGFRYNPKHRITVEEFLNDLYFQEEPKAAHPKSLSIKIQLKRFEFPVKDDVTLLKTLGEGNLKRLFKARQDDVKPNSYLP